MSEQEGRSRIQPVSDWCVEQKEGLGATTTGGMGNCGWLDVKGTDGDNTVDDTRSYSIEPRL